MKKNKQRQGKRKFNAYSEIAGKKCHIHTREPAVAYNDEGNPVCSQCLKRECQPLFNNRLAVKHGCRQEEIDALSSMPSEILDAIDEYKNYG